RHGRGGGERGRVPRLPRRQPCDRLVAARRWRLDRVVTGMRRREVIGGLVGAVTWVCVGCAQEPKRHRIGISMSTAENELHEQAAIEAFVAALARLGWEAGRNLDIMYRWGAGDAARMTVNANELVASAPDAILAKGGTMPALRDATATIPIVVVVTGDDAALSYAG